MIRTAAALTLAVAIAVIAPARARAEAAPPPDVDFAAGVVAYLDGDYETAVRLLRRAIEAAPASGLGATRYLGMSLVALEDFDGALDVLEPAVEAHPDELDLRVDLGVVYVLAGNDGFAARTLAAAVERAPGSARARFYLGVALVRLGDCELAGQHLAEARRLDEAFEARARYLTGLCLARAGDVDEAREELTPLASSPLDEPVADAARRFVRLALRADGIETARVSARAATSIQYDSNPTLAPGTLERFDSVGLVLQADATVRALATERHTLAGQVAFYRSFYWPDDHAAEYDYTHVAASAFYQLRGRLGEARHQLQVGYDFALGLFDGDPPLTDGNHLYSELHGLRTIWSIRETDRLQTRVSLLAQSRTYAMLRRNAVALTVGLGQTVSFPAQGLQMYLEGTVRVEDAHSLDYDVVAPGFLMSLSGRLPWELILSGWALYEHEAHPGSSEGRTDEQLTVSLSLQRQIVRHLGLTLAWFHGENLSTVERYAYRRDVVSLTLWGAL